MRTLGLFETPTYPNVSIMSYISTSEGHLSCDFANTSGSSLTKIGAFVLKRTSWLRFLFDRDMKR